MPLTQDPNPTILALNTTGRTASVALYRSGVWTTDADLDGVDDRGTRIDAARKSKKPIMAASSSATLIPSIDHLCRRRGVSPRDIDVIAIPRGPGSFTGLRIGIVTAKTLAWANEIRLVGLDTLECLAWQTADALDLENGRLVTAVMNAQRRQIFVESFRVEREDHGTASNLISLGPIQILDPADLIAQMPPSSLLTGSGVKLAASHLEKLPPQRIAPTELWPLKILTVGKMGLAHTVARRFVDPFRLVPHYVRPSYAEEQ